MSEKWLNGIYLTTDVVLDHPDYVTRLRDEIGLNTVVLGFTGEMSDEVMKQAGMDIPSRDRSEPVSGSGLEALVTEMEQHFQPVEGSASMSEDEKNEMYRKLVETVFGEEK